MKKLSILFVLMFSISSAHAVVIKSFNNIQPKGLNIFSYGNPMSQFFMVKPAPPLAPVKVIPPAKNEIVLPAKLEILPQVSKIQTIIPEQHFVFFDKDYLKEIVNCVEGPKGQNDDNVSAVPVPAALPLMATALGIFGITRRRKTH